MTDSTSTSSDSPIPPVVPDAQHGVPQPNGSLPAGSNHVQAPAAGMAQPPAEVDEIEGAGWFSDTDRQDHSVDLSVYAPTVAMALDFARREDVAAADVHFRQDSTPWLRRGGVFQPEPSLPPTPESDLKATIQWCGGMEISTTRVFPQDSNQRWRCQTFRAHSGLKIVFRRLAGQPASFDDLGPSVSDARKAAMLGEGLIVVAGATGSGKSTTLTALLSLINQQRGCHIITIENPIEVVHKPSYALIEQREVGYHMDSALTAFHSALRSDPDVIMLGELRTEEEADLCLEAAVSGHLVLTTMHAKDAGTVCERLLAGQGPSARSKLAQAIQLIVAQRLVPDATDKYRRHLIAEMCFRSTAIVNKIRQGDLSVITNTIYEETQGGLDARLAEAVKDKKITEGDAIRAALDVQAFQDQLHHTDDANPLASSRGQGSGNRISRRG